MGDVNPLERQKRIKLDQLNLNVGKVQARLQEVRQQVAAATGELERERAALEATRASVLQTVQEVWCVCVCRWLHQTAAA